jgi:hypothetical protein
MPDKITGKYNIFYNTSGYLTIPNEEAIEVTMLSKIKKDDNCFCKADSLSILAIDIKNKSWKLI